MLEQELIPLLYLQGAGNVESITTPTTASAEVDVSPPSVASITALTLHGATPVIKLPAPAAGMKKTLYLIEDSTGSRVPTWATFGAGAVKWSGGSAPTLTTAANAVDKVVAECFDGTNWECTATLHFA